MRVILGRVGAYVFKAMRQVLAQEQGFKFALGNTLNIPLVFYYVLPFPAIFLRFERSCQLMIHSWGYPYLGPTFDEYQLISLPSSSFWGDLQNITSF